MEQQVKYFTIINNVKYEDDVFNVLFDLACSKHRMGMEIRIYNNIEEEPIALITNKGVHVFRARKAAV